MSEQSRNVIVVDMTWVLGLTPEERKQFSEQALELVDLFEGRERENVTGVLMNLATVAMVATRQEEDRSVGSVIPTEWTTPADHLRDDLGTIVAFVLQRIESEVTLPAVKIGWTKVVGELKRQM